MSVIGWWVENVLAPTGIATGVGFGTPELFQAGLYSTSIDSLEAFGTPTVVPGAASITPTGIGTSEAFGTCTVTLAAQPIDPTGISSGETFGSHTAKFTLPYTVPFTI